MEKEITTLGVLRGSFEKKGCWKDSVSVGKRARDYVIPAWNAGIQVDMDVSGRILRAWMRSSPEPFKVQRFKVQRPLPTPNPKRETRNSEVTLPA